jgi:type I restriction enzyme S subunit
MRLRFVTRRTITQEQRRKLSEVKEATFLPMEAIGEQGELDVGTVRNVDEVQTGYTLFFDGDVVVAKITPCFENGKGALISRTLNGVGYGTTELHVLSPGPNLNGRFLYYITVSEPLRKLGEAGMTGAAGQKRVPEDFVRDYRVPLPSLRQQCAIADYLDQETARLNDLVAEKERLLKLLAEKRRALITHAVTRGLDSLAPLRDSGIPWLGQIPAHWELRRAKFLFCQSSLPVRDDDEMVTCFRDGQVTLRKNRREEGFTNAIKELGYQGIRKGQLVLHSMDAFAGAIGVSDSDGKCSPEYIICDPIEIEVVNEYYGNLLRVMALNGFIQASCPAVRERAPRIRFSDFGEMFLPVPIRTEQRAIVAHIAKETAKLDALRAATERTIALLKERRAALIAAAVTGQIELEMDK